MFYLSLSQASISEKKFFMQVMRAPVMLFCLSKMFMKCKLLFLLLFVLMHDGWWHGTLVYYIYTSLWKLNIHNIVILNAHVIGWMMLVKTFKFPYQNWFSQVQHSIQEWRRSTVWQKDCCRPHSERKLWCC